MSESFDDSQGVDIWPIKFPEDDPAEYYLARVSLFRDEVANYLGGVDGLVDGTNGYAFWMLDDFSLGVESVHTDPTRFLLQMDGTGMQDRPTIRLLVQEYFADPTNQEQQTVLVTDTILDEEDVATTMLTSGRVAEMNGREILLKSDDNPLVETPYLATRSASRTAGVIEYDFPTRIDFLSAAGFGDGDSDVYLNDLDPLSMLDVLVGADETLASLREHWPRIVANYAGGA